MLNILRQIRIWTRITERSDYSFEYLRKVLEELGLLGERFRFTKGKIERNGKEYVYYTVSCEVLVNDREFAMLVCKLDEPKTLHYGIRYL